MRLLPLAALSTTALLLALPLAGCPGFGACTEIAVASVTVHVDDVDGLSIDDADVTFDSEEADGQECESLGGGDYVCGYEIDGEITVDAAKDGYLPASGSVVVEMDEEGCHVVGELLDLVLEPDAVIGR